MRRLVMNKPQCLLYSAAMILNEHPVDLIKEIGHDGMEIWWPEFHDHRQFRSHSMQEMIDIFLSRGKTLTPIQTFPMQSPLNMPEKAKPTFEEYAARFYAHVARKKAILIGKTSCGKGHAWAWDGYHAHDPRGSMHNIRDLSLQEAWVMHNINSDI